MPRPTIIVTIDEEAAVTVRVQGVTGPSCYAATRQTEEDLGAVVSDERTREYSLRAQQTAHVRQDHR